MKTGPKIIRDGVPIEALPGAPVASQQRVEGEQSVGSNDLIKGPSQETPQDEAIRVRAAVETAIGAMQSARVAIQRGVHPSVVPAIGQLADSFRAAICALAGGGFEEERTRLFDSLGAILGPLEQLVAQVSAEKAPKKARDLKDALVAAYRDLLTPTV